MEQKLPWIFVVCFGCLSVYNFLQNQEVNSRFLQLQKDTKGVNRYRRDVSDNGDEKDWNKFMLKFPAQRICKDFVYVCAKDKCKEEDTTIIKTTKADGSSKESGATHECIRGPQGPPGPPGPGLESPKLVRSTLSNGKVNITKSKTFECTFYGNPVPMVTWKSPSKNFKIVSYIDQQKLEITSRLLIANTSFNEQGRVECHAKSILGEAHDSGNLTALTKPIILNHITLVFVPEGITFNFPECKVRSNPPAKITWKRIFWSMSAGRFTTKQNNLQISNVQFKDEGFYVCEAENYLGKDKATTQLKVNFLQIHKSSPEYIVLRPGQYANINCSAYGNAKEMTGKITKKYDVNVPFTGERAASGNLISVKASVKEEGNYMCIIQNKDGKRAKASVNVEVLTECRIGWTERSGFCYGYINQRKTWHKAESFCQSKGGHLASIMSVQENSFIYGLTPQGWGDYWIGLNDEDEENTFKWSDGNATTYSYFYPRQPNGRRRQNCVGFYDSGNGKWDDFDCNYECTFICKVAR